MKKLILLLLIPLAAYGQEGVTVTNKANFPVQTKIVNSDPIHVVMSGGGGGSPGGSNKQVQFNNVGAFGGALNLTYDLTQLPGSDASTHAVTIGSPESTLPANLQGAQAPVHTLFTANKVAGVGYDTAVAIEAYSDSGYMEALAIDSMGTTGTLFGIGISPIIGGSGNLNNLYGIFVYGTSRAGGGTATVTNAYGVRIDSQNSSGFVTNSYALYINDQGASNYAIKVQGGINDLGPQATTVGSLVILPGGGINGTVTNDNASALNMGEEIESLKDNAHTVSLSNGTAANITSISLTAGDWDVEGNVNFTEATSTVTARSAGISATSATLPTDGSEAYCGVQSTVTSEVNSITLPRKRISIATTTVVYLVGKASFSAGTCAGFGAITARRVR